MFAMSADLPVPSWKRTRQPASPRVTLTQDVIVETALRLLDRDGLDGVSMRRVAEELNTGAASLYAHVANKEELLDLVLDKISSEVDIPEPDPEHWQDQIRDIGMRMYAIYGAHRDIAVVNLANIPTSPNALRVAEGTLAILLAGGVPPQIAAWALDRLALYISADAYEGSLLSKRQIESGLPMAEFIEKFTSGIRDFYANLPSDRFPAITTHLGNLISGSSEQRFAFGLDMIIRSLATYAEESRPAR
jgi:AcrR family transcriptional regulator